MQLTFFHDWNSWIIMGELTAEKIKGIIRAAFVTYKLENLI